MIMGGDNKSFIEFIIQNLEMVQQLYVFSTSEVMDTLLF